MTEADSYHIDLHAKQSLHNLIFANARIRFPFKKVQKSDRDWTSSSIQWRLCFRFYKEFFGTFYHKKKWHNLIYAPFTIKGWTRWSFQASCKLGCSVILWFCELPSPINCTPFLRAEHKVDLLMSFFGFRFGFVCQPIVKFSYYLFLRDVMPQQRPLSLRESTRWKKTYYFVPVHTDIKNWRKFPCCMFWVLWGFFV